MLPDVYTIFVGVTTFALLVVASWCVGEGGEILGKKYDASIVGGLVIAWLNTAPETIFFITALESDNPRFAVGAVSGSSIGTTPYATPHGSRISIIIRNDLLQSCARLRLALACGLVLALASLARSSSSNRYPHPSSTRSCATR
jgi:Ca2+/H+ antiporter